jgi:hypothetical protein
MTRHQKRAWCDLALSIVWSVTLLPMFIIRGNDAFHDPGVTRLTLFILIAGGLAFWGVSYLTRPKPGEQVETDERDRLIMSKASKYQHAGVYLNVCLWAIWLWTSYEDEGQVPVMFMWLILLSTMLVSALFRSAGILISYWLAKWGGIES